MITLNTDKGLIEITDWEDLIARPAFRGNLDPSQHKLQSIIGTYIEKEWKPCGLSNCHHLHGKGYYVVTESGLETNIGKDCGKTYLDANFDDFVRNYHRDVTNKNNRQRLWDFTFRLDEIEAKIDYLRRTDADRLYLNCRALIQKNDGCPDKISRLVREMLKTGSNLLIGEREATEKEIKEIEFRESREIKARPHMIEYAIAEISGLQALHAENDLRSLLVIDLQSNITDFKTKDIDSMTPTELKKWAKWVDTVEVTFGRALESVQHAKRLLEPANLRPFLQIIEGEEIPLFRRYLARLDQTSLATS
jgi:hypothetical protein